MAKTSKPRWRIPARVTDADKSVELELHASREQIEQAAKACAKKAFLYHRGGRISLAMITLQLDLSCVLPHDQPLA